MDQGGGVRVRATAVAGMYCEAAGESGGNVSVVYFGVIPCDPSLLFAARVIRLNFDTRLGLTKVHGRSGFKPFMEYAGSYALFNYCLVDSDVGMEYSNLRLVRAFEKGLDPSSSEAGFVLVHVDMVKNSGLLVEGAIKVLGACKDDDRNAFNAGLDLVIKGMAEVNRVMDGMSNSLLVHAEMRKD